MALQFSRLKIRRPETPLAGRHCERRRPAETAHEGRFVLQVDRRRRTTREAAQKAGMALKQTFPILHVGVIGAAVTVLTFGSGVLYQHLGGRGFWVMAALGMAAIPIAMRLQVRE